MSLQAINKNGVLSILGVLFICCNDGVSVNPNARDGSRKTKK